MSIKEVRGEPLTQEEQDLYDAALALVALCRMSGHTVIISIAKSEAGGNMLLGAGDHNLVAWMLLEALHVITPKDK